MNKQIEEMAREVIGGCEECSKCPLSFQCKAYEYATKFYTAGYRKQIEWISVDEKLPKHLEKVLVCDDKQNMFTALYVVFDNGGFDWCTSVRLVYKVTHWMPLPMPPKGDEGK